MIRNFEKKDIEGIIEILKDHKKKLNQKYDEKTKSLFEMEEFENLYVYEKENKVIAYINFHMINFPIIAGKEIYISDLIVDEKNRGFGIGRILLDFVKKYAKVKGVSRIMLNNFTESEAYKRDFYIKNGFSKRDTMSNMIFEIY